VIHKTLFFDFYSQHSQQSQHSPKSLAAQRISMLAGSQQPPTNRQHTRKPPVSQGHSIDRNPYHSPTRQHRSTRAPCPTPASSIAEAIAWALSRASTLMVATYPACACRVTR
jgi:hypothetical protein